MRVLCLDDDQIYLTVAQGYLKVLGASHVRATSNYDRALQLVQEEQIELILLDLNMPGQDGLAFLRSLSEAGFRGQIIIASGENASIVTSSGYIGQKLGLNVQDTLRKPLQIEELRAAFERAKKASTADKAEEREEMLPHGKIIPVLYFQPQYAADTGALKGCEALVRGKDAQGNIFGAASVLRDFKDNADRLAFSALLFESFCADVAALRGRGFTCNFSFNVDALSLEMPQFIPMLSEAIMRHGISSEGIVIEMTEAELPTNEAWLLEVIARISIAGFQVSMDDFSTGAASFDLLRAGAFREVKLDSTLIKRSRTDTPSAKFIANVVDIADAMNMRVIGEGVEDQQDKDRLAAMGVGILQGYYLGKPMSKDDLVNEPSSKILPLSAAC